MSKKVKDMKKFAITGTIGSGKSTVSILFKRFQIPVFDADGYSKSFNYLPNTELLVQIDSDKQIEQADTVIYNDGSLKELNTEVRNWIKENK